MRVSDETISDNQKAKACLLSAPYTETPLYNKEISIRFVWLVLFVFLLLLHFS